MAPVRETVTHGGQTQVTRGYQTFYVWDDVTRQWFDAVTLEPTCSGLVALFVGSCE